MPNGTPTAAQIWNGDISFFSLDTDLIQSAGYDFEKGSLNQLPKQLPKSMQLQLSEIVKNEIVDHLLDPVVKDSGSFVKAASDIARRTQLDMLPIDAIFSSMNVVESARKAFSERVQNYAARCRGGVLPIEGDGISAKLFELYFSNKPPFEANKDKKSEFPDAMSLILLEEYAKDEGKLGLIASGDRGWKAFADASPYLYCVHSIEELTKLFVDAGEHGKRIGAKVMTTAQDRHSLLRALVSDALSNHVEQSEWKVGEIYSSGNTRVEAEAHGANLFEFSIENNLIKVWSLDEEPSTWVVELEVSVTAEVEVQITHYVWDSIDREELRLKSESVSLDKEIEVQVFLTCSVNNDESSPEEWNIEVEVAAGQYEIDVGEVDPFFED